jgi:16S rRNA (cytidine1402-2'-O)-methyltransferase
MAGTLSLVATPIGNLGDITARALEVLRTADVVLAEDTRNTGHLLMHFGITTKVRSYHQHSSEKEVSAILSLLDDGMHLALVTDAGTPGVSDPGNMLIHTILERKLPVVITPVVGASALTAALSISGFSTDRFIFLGFPPHKNKRKKYFEELATYPCTICFYESCHRIEKAILNMVEVLDPTRRIVICRELTKKFETVYRGTIAEVQEMHIPSKGEFVVIVEKRMSHY